MLKKITTDVLEVAYFDNSVRGEPTVFLLHGFPYDVHAFNAVIPVLATNGCRVITPYLRGYGPTRFLSPDTPRSGQQAVLAHDLIALMDALEISKAVAAGFDWGGRAACIAAALWPKRILGLVSVGGYNIQDIPGSVMPSMPENEYRFWYQYIFTPRGVGVVLRKIGANCVNFSGGCGRRLGNSLKRSSTSHPSPLTILILSMW